MAKFLLDSDVAIEWLRRTPAVVDWVRARVAAGDVLGWTPVSIAEVLAGLRPSEEGPLRALLTLLDVVEIDRDVGRKAGRYLQTFRASHGLGIADALIAASAHSAGFTLCSRNLRHYPMRDVRKLAV